MTYKDAIKKLWFTKDYYCLMAWVIYILPFVVSAFTGSTWRALVVPLAFFLIVPAFVQWSVNDIEKRKANGEYV